MVGAPHSGADRDQALLAMQDGQQALLGVRLRAAGLKLAVVHTNLLVLHPLAPIPEGLSRLSVERAGELLGMCDEPDYRPQRCAGPACQRRRAAGGLADPLRRHHSRRHRRARSARTGGARARLACGWRGRSWRRTGRIPSAPGSR
jgi:hypothetical protein